jgi:mRNA interferase RelE/StbE
VAVEIATTKFHDSASCRSFPRLRPGSGGQKLWTPRGVSRSRSRSTAGSASFCWMLLWRRVLWQRLKMQKTLLGRMPRPLRSRQEATQPRWKRWRRSWVIRLAEGYSVVLSSAAAQALRALDKPIQNRILAALQLLRDTLRPPAAKSLVGHPAYLRIRIADYRVVYSVSDGQLLIPVILLRHRSRTYKDLER